MRLLLLVLLALPTPAAAQADDEQARVVRALAVRHDPPPCDALIADLADPAATLAWVVDHVPLPPWVGIRAARCAATLPDAAPHVARWLVDPGTPGLAEGVAPVLALLPPERARALVRVAEVGPHRQRFFEAWGDRPLPDPPERP